MKSLLSPILLISIILSACSNPPPPNKDTRSDRIERLAAELKEGDPWPEIREKYPR
jgi:hypothetical protein